MLLPLLLLACGEAPAPSPDAQAPAGPVVGFGLAYSGNVDGEIEPCG